MKKILLIGVAVLALSACDQNKEEAREHATNANNAIEVPVVAPSSGDPGTVSQQQAQDDNVRTPQEAIVGGAMVNTPVPASSSAMQNTPAPTVAEATAEAGAAASPCGADQSWVGKSLQSIDLSKVTSVIRTLYPDQPATMDYSEQRLNIIIERGTDKVLEAKCG